MKRLSIFLAIAAALIQPAPAQIADKAVRAKIAGIDLIAYKTDVRDVVTVRCSLW